MYLAAGRGPRRAALLVPSSAPEVCGRARCRCLAVAYAVAERVGRGLTVISAGGQLVLERRAHEAIESCST
jgi:hypothetical protein